MTTLKVLYTDMWCQINGHNFLFSYLLRKHYNVVFTNKDPDLVIFSVFGNRHRYYKDAITLLVNFENRNDVDFPATYTISGNPNSSSFCYPYSLLTAFTYKNFLINNTGDYKNKLFASFVALNANAIFRKNFVWYLSRNYKRIHCPGAVFHNTPYWIGRSREDKIQELSKYKFNIAFENTNKIGYVTEKVIDAWLAGTVPIYWGGDYYIYPFDKKGMIYVNDFPSLDSVLDYIKQVDNDDELYAAISANNPLRQPSFWYDIEHIQHQLEEFLVMVAERALNRKNKRTCAI